METRANFILIGLFTILGIVGSLAFFVWLASVQIDRQYARFGILFENVSGLDQSGDVFFNGVGVGRVTGIRIWEEDPSLVYVGIEVDSVTPIRTDTVGQLRSQGVTGVAYIALTGGTPDAPVLERSDGTVPIITSELSTVQSIVEDAPDLIAEATQIMSQLQSLTGPQNQALVTQILSNIEASSGRLESALEDFSQISTTVRDATAQITLFTNRLDEIGLAVETTLTTAGTTLDAATRAFAEAESVLNGTTEAITSAQAAFASADLLMQNDVPRIAGQISSVIDTLGSSSENLLDQLNQTAALSNARLAGLEQTLVEAETAFAAVTETSINIDTLFSGEGALLVADARQGLASLQASLDGLQAVIEDDVPPMVSDVRAAAATANASISQIATRLSAASDRIGPLLDDAQATLTSATGTFTQSRATLDRLDSALTAATTAFDGANTIIAESLDPLLADIGVSATRVSQAVAVIAEDAPEITQDLLALIERTDATVADLQRAVAQSAPGVQAFAQAALPQFELLVREARGLIASIGTLTRRIEQDPAGLVLDNRVPEYRR